MKMSLKQVKYLVYALAALLFFVTLAAYWFHSVGLSVLAAGLCTAIVAIGRTMWRCPHCGKPLGRIERAPGFCQNCGGELEDLE